MKKFRLLSLLLAILLALIGVASADIMRGEEDEYKPTNDIVIVLDMSDSMLNNDPDGYRLDAAQMIVGMCDMENSRVAIVPFAGPKLAAFKHDTEFVSISEAKSRIQKMKELENLRDVPYRYNTDLGNALSYAMMLVMNRRDQSNAPMIIALTDGANFISKEGNAKNYDSQEVYLWDADSNTYRTAIVKDYGKDNNNSSSNRDINGRALIVNSDTQQADAVEAARVNQVPIYTIALKGNANTASSRNEIRSFVDTLKQMADTTGGQCIETDFGNAHDLPTAFGKLFANQIGSSLLEQLSPVRETGRTYRVDIPILNNSVHEANIYIPLENIDVSSIKLTNADGEDRTYTQADVTRLESSNRFILYKIHAPRSVGGDWVLRFDLKDSALSVSDISLKTSIGTGYSSMLEH